MSDTSIPERLYLECPNCGKETLHEVVSVKGGHKSGQHHGKGTVEVKVLCTECERTRIESLSMEDGIELRVIISSGASSRRTTMPANRKDVFHVTQELFVDGINMKVTGVETAQRRVQRASAESIVTLWVTEYESVILKISISKEGVTKNYSMVMEPHHEVAVGDVLRVKDLKLKVKKINLSHGKLDKKGDSAPANRIVRVYCTYVTDRRKGRNGGVRFHDHGFRGRNGGERFRDHGPKVSRRRKE